GTVPAPGWTGRYEWRGFRSERDRPDARAVRLGYAVSANDSIPRLRRIEQAFAASTSFGTDGFEQLQHDTQAWNAEQLVPLLAAVRSDRVEIEEARSRLLQWDRRLGAESSEATLYVLWERSLLRRLIASKVPAALVDEVAARADAVLIPAVTMPSSV